MGCVHNRNGALQALGTDPDEQGARVGKDNDKVAGAEEELPPPHRGVGGLSVRPELAAKRAVTGARGNNHVPIGAAHAGSGTALLNPNNMHTELPNLSPNERGPTSDKAATCAAVSEGAHIKGGKAHSGDHVGSSATPPGSVFRGGNQARRIGARPGLREDEVVSMHARVGSAALRGERPHKLPLQGAGHDKLAAEGGRKGAAPPLARALRKTVGKLVPRITIMCAHMAERHIRDLTRYK